MASNVVFKLFRPPVVTQLSCFWMKRYCPPPAQVSLCLGNTSLGKAVVAVAGTRHFSSDSPEKISRFPVPYKKDLPYDIVELMVEMETKGGFLPNVFKVFSHRPAEFRAFFAYYNELMNKETGRLTKADRELIVVATSIHNKCLYCVVAHSALHRIYSKNPTLADQVIINYQNAALSPREHAMLDFAMAVCRCDTITEQHFKSLEEVGFDREDAWDIAAIAAFFAMSNRLAFLTGMRPNSEFYNMGRIPRNKSNNKAGEEDK